MAAWLRAPRHIADEGLPLILRLTLVEVFLVPLEVWYLRPFSILFACLGLLFPAVLWSPATWLAIALLAGSSLARMWPFSDNHYYLFAYWCLSLGLALTTAKPREALARSSRWLIALVFLLATLWKAVLAPDFLDGRFFRVTLLTDERFGSVAQLFGGISGDELETSRQYLEASPADAGLADLSTLREPPALRRVALTLTWATVLLEGAVAIAFLFPWGRWTPRVRHGVLLTFCVVTFALAPVPGFGWLLVVMGLSQTAPDQRRLRLTYVLVWFLILLCGDISWTQLVVRFLGGG